MTQLNQYKLLMKWVSKFYLDNTRHRQFEHNYYKKLELLYRTKGPKWTSNYFKLSRLAITKTLNGEHLDRPFGISLNKLNLPSFIPHALCVKILDGDKLTITYVLTVLQYTRMILGDPKDLDCSSIERPWTGKNPLTRSIIALIAHDLNLTSLNTEFSHFPWIGSAGPNGLSILRSFEDAVNIPDELSADLSTLAGEKFGDLVFSIRGFWSVAKQIYLTMFKYTEDKKKLIRKIAIKQDKEGKTRPFAIFEYISQAALQPLHDSLFQALKSLEWDCTFDQSKGFRDILYGASEFKASYDLKSATDRFPIVVQREILAYLTSDEKADAWVRCMTKYPFKLPNGKLIKFNTGQPLGAKSSWAMFTLAHHFVVHYCAREVGVKPSYRLLGDDIVITDPELAIKYKAVMTELGVEISETKSHSGTLLFEFAKRFGYKGSEITQFPITALLSNIKEYCLTSQVLSGTAPERGFLPLFILGRSPQYWETLLSIPYSKSTRLYTAMIKKYELFQLLPSSTKPSMVELSDTLMLGAAACGRVPTVQEASDCLLRAVKILKEREILKLTNLVQKYNLSIMSMLSAILMTPVWGLVKAPHREYIPVISALDNSKDLCNKVLDAMSEEGQTGWSVYRKLEENPIRPMPSLKGLQPTRPKELVTRSRSALLKPLMEEFKTLTNSPAESK